jgi:hypothetical protein
MYLCVSIILLSKNIYLIIVYNIVMILWGDYRWGLNTYGHNSVTTSNCSDVANSHSAVHESTRLVFSACRVFISFLVMASTNRRSPSSGLQICLGASAVS